MNARRCLLLAITLGALLAPALASADDSDVSFDASVDFRALRTFAIVQGHLTTDKPEIDNRLFRQRLEDSIRATLLEKGLTEVAERPDVSVSWYFHDTDVSAVERGTGRGPNPVLYTQGTLVIDLNNASNSLLWRGTWRDQERNGPKLSRKLSGDARKLLSRYPPKRK
jgi:hypothetical protein